MLCIQVAEVLTMQEIRASQLYCSPKQNLRLMEYLQLTLLLPLGEALSHFC